jgi:hypothetical protein
MRYYKSSGFYLTIINILYILNIKYLNGINIQCEQCNSNENGKCVSDLGVCPSYCRPHFYEDRCYDCSGVFKNNANLLYSINENECIPPIQDNDRYIISETNEVVKNNDALDKTKTATSLDIKRFGNFLYKTCPRYTEATQIGDSNKCKCTDTTNFFLYADKVFDVTHYRCVNSCPQGYNYYYSLYENYICTEINNVTPFQHIRPNNTLTQNCDSDQPYIVNYVQIGETKFYYCLNKCPESLPFFEDNPDKPNEKECLDKCPDNYFYYKDTKECIQNCANYQSWIDIKTKTFICVKPSSAESNINSACPAEFPYKYGSSCLRNCSDTNDAFFSSSSSHFGTDNLQKTTYSLIMNEEKKCVINCNTEPNGGKKYHEDITFTCVSDCSKTSRKYDQNNECVEKCDDTKYHNYESFSCVDSCSDSFYKYGPVP